MSYKALIALLELADHDAGQTANKVNAAQIVAAGWAEYGESVTDESDDDWGFAYVYLTDRGKAVAQLLLSTATLHASK